MQSESLAWQILYIDSWLSIGLRFVVVVFVYMAARLVCQRLARQPNGDARVLRLPFTMAGWVFLFILPMPMCEHCRQLGGHHILVPEPQARRYRQRHGRYPANLAELCSQMDAQRDLRLLCVTGKDRWGNPILYESKGDGYVVVSFGRDGKPDGIDYWKLREQRTHRRVCGELDADYVVSDRGSHQGCGK